MSSKKKTGTAPLIATIATAAVATVAVVILLIVMGTRQSSDNPTHSVPNEIGFVATPEIFAECEEAAGKLVSANYEIIRLYVTEGLTPEKVYGRAEILDGAYVVKSDKYDNYSQIEALVKSVYTPEAAEKILKETTVSLGGTTKTIQVYADRDYNGYTVIGMNTQFFIDKNYKTDWSNCFITVEPQSGSMCEVTVCVNGVSAEEAANHPESVLKATMTKTDEGWRFTEFLK